MTRWDLEYISDEGDRQEMVARVDHVAALDALRREMARACEVCGRAAQQLGTEARCAEHDSEKEMGR